jgi:radical SAM superfamily enzyme YgiQ (UPF0313 family)
MKSHRLMFVALSGVRVRNAELLKLGLTLPGFVDRGKTIAELPSLSLLTLAAYTPSHWEVTYREVDHFGDTEINEIAASSPDIIAISSLTARILQAYRLSDELRTRGMTVVMGGLHVSALPDEAQQHCDSIVCGEGESVWPSLIEDFERGQLQRRYRSKPHHFLNELPTPRYDLLNPHLYNRIPLQTTRGCPLACTFCAASRTISSYKRKPIPLVRRELEAILEIWPKPFIELADDNTFVDKTWGNELIQLFQDYPIRWFTETDISIADDQVLLENLARAGCAQLLIGFESSSKSAFQHVEHYGWKSRRFDKYREDIAKIQSHGISVNGCFILGHDSDTIETFAETRDFIYESELSEVQITLLTPFPSTALYQRLRKENRLIDESFWDKCTLFDLVYQPARMSFNELESGFRWLMSELYSPHQTRLRKQKFRDCARARRESHRQDLNPTQSI